MKDREKIMSDYFNSVGKEDLLRDIKKSGMEVPDVEFLNAYQKETVEHLVDQLIKLQQEYTNSYIRSNYIDRKQIYEAMKKMNKVLDMVLFPQFIVK